MTLEWNECSAHFVVEAAVLKCMPTVRSFVNFRRVFERLSWHSENVVRQAVLRVLCTDTWLQFAVTGTTLVVLVGRNTVQLLIVSKHQSLSLLGPNFFALRVLVNTNNKDP